MLIAVCMCKDHVRKYIPKKFTPHHNTTFALNNCVPSSQVSIAALFPPPPDHGLLQYVKDHVGPLAQNFTEQMCKCSQTYCNGHGRCMPRYNNGLYLSTHVLSTQYTVQAQTVSAILGSLVKTVRKNCTRQQLHFTL